MFFLLKCAFWLGLVYAAMLYGFGPIKPIASDGLALKQAAREPARDVLHTGETAVRAAVDGAASGVAALCLQHPKDCLADAARLKALFDSSGTVDPVAPGQDAPSPRHGGKISPSADPAIVARDAVDVPMPVADPRRRGKVSRLTSGL